MENVLLVDFESTGTDPAVDQPTEVAAVVFSLRHNAVLSASSSLITVDREIPEKVQVITGITQSMTLGAFTDWPHLARLGDMADAVVAHKAGFDKAFADQLGLWGDLPWIDSMEIDWPNPIARRGSKLSDIALSYSIPVWKPHRALTDCQLLANIFQAEPQSAELLEKELEPKVWVVAGLISRSSEGTRDLAKEHGFRWEGGESQTPGYFSRRMHLDDVISLPLELGPVVTEPNQWEWVWLDCGKEDKRIHALAKDWGFKFNQPDHPMPWKWMRWMDRSHAVRLEHEGLPVMFAENMHAN